MSESTGAQVDRPISAVFLDRDGTIIRDSGYLSEPADVHLLPGAADAIRAFNERRIPVVVVTNQSGIGRGYYTEAQFQTVQEEVERQLAERGARLDGVFHCPHVPEAGCECRKPGIALYRLAGERLGVDLSLAVYAGNRASDVEPILAFGGIGLLVADATGRYDGRAPSGCVRAPTLAAGVRRILAGARGGLSTHAGEG